MGSIISIVEGLESTDEVVLLDGFSIRRREFHFNTRTSGVGSIRNNRFFKHLTTDLRNNTRQALASLILVSVPLYTGCSFHHFLARLIIKIVWNIDENIFRWYVFIHFVTKLS